MDDSTASAPSAGDGSENAAAAEELADLELVRHDDGSFELGSLHIPPPPPPALTFDNEKRPRLMITHIDNENFKSYAGRQTLGPFHKSFTSIVGPNGSGKSNVIDSMLFVFGYRAQKIRSKKISVLIHNSEQHQHLQHATVTVHFQEIIDKDAVKGKEAGDDGEDKENKQQEAADEAEAGFDVVENSRFSVSRTVHRDNSAYYRINDRKVTFKEVQELLKKKGVDLDHNRFLILQGEVEQIALMKPKAQGPNDTGMLEFLEDIIGSSRFQEPIDLLKESVSKLEEVRGEKLNRVKLVEKEKDELEGPRNEALDYIRLENEITEKKNLATQYYVAEHEAKIQATEEKKAKYEESASETLNKAKEVAEARAQGEERQTANRKHLEKVRAELEDTQERFKAHELKDQSMKEEMRTLNNKRKKLMVLAKTESEKYEKEKRVPEKNHASIEECEKHKERLEAAQKEEKAKYDVAIATLNEETKQYQDEKEVHENELTGLKDTLNERQGLLRETQTEVDLLKSNEEKERCKLEQFTATKEKAERDLEENAERYSDLSASLPEARKELPRREKEVQKLAEKEAGLAEKLHKAQAEFQEKNSIVSSTKGRGRVIEALMAEKAAGRLPGVYGRLGDLGAIDAKYDIAVSTAGGGKLDQIVVDNGKTGTACINFLRQHNVGRATFLLLDKQAQTYGNKRQGDFKGPDRDALRLFDLLKVSDQKFLPAFYAALRDTLVAADMESAQRYAFGRGTRNRVVTLRGQLIEVTGAMTMGGRPISGKMGSQVAQQAEDIDLNALRADVDRLRDAHGEVVREKADLERAVVNARKVIAAQEKEFEKLDFLSKSLTEKIAGLKEQIKNQAVVLKEAKPDQAKLKELAKREAAQQAAVDETQEKVDEVQIKVAKLNKKIKEIKSSKLSAINKKLEEVTDQLGKVKGEISKLTVGITSAERNVKKIKDRLEGYEKEVQEAEDRMRDLKRQRTELDVEGNKVIEDIKSLQEDESESAGKSEKLAEEVKKLKEAEDKLKSEQIEINQVREKFDSEIKDLSRTCGHWKRELRKLKLKEVPGEGMEDLELPKHSKETLDEVDIKSHSQALTILEEKLASQNANFAAIEEFNKKEAVYLNRVNELTTITTRKDLQKKYFEELRKQRLTEFLKGFGLITTKLKEMYQMITLGGDAELELVDTLDPFSEGITFSVRPPKKSWKNISNLSGGEKTLSSLALVFALHYYKPTPLYVMDEIDAALDFKNVSIVANYIKERTKNAQFIIISLRSNMFELADRLVGIYKTYNCTKSVTINPEAVAAKANMK